MLRFVGLRSKLYSYEQETANLERKQKKVAKGIKSSIKDKKLSVDLYENCLFNKTQERVSVNSIKTDHHQLFSIQTNKTALTMCDSKRYICSDGISTLAHGHYKIKKL